jgi:hypothetical protein
MLSVLLSQVLSDICSDFPLLWSKLEVAFAEAYSSSIAMSRSYGIDEICETDKITGGLVKKEREANGDRFLF